ncbi:MAG TPA: hypothetical protein VFG69_09155 [Nannocystaceae bacterium]|nr:hypothetical protein [Nannocystaceae bacterium]
MELAVGKDIASICGKCGDVWHVIVAVDASHRVTKVQCKMCSGYHRYKRSPSDPAPESKRKVESKAAKAKKTARATPHHNSPTIEPNLALPVRDYSMRETYQTGERIEHPKFGQGVVESFPTPDKMNVFFEDGRRTLAQGRPMADAVAS